jgi:hypothetical protein
MKTKQIKVAALTAVMGIVAPLAMIAPASAATQVFESRSAVDIGKMAASTSWVSSVVPVDGDTVSFPASAKYQTINNDISSLSLVKILFDGESTLSTSSKSFTISGNGFTITSGIDAIMTGLGGEHAVNTDVSLGADVTFKTTGVNTLTVGGTGTTLDLNGNDLTLDAAGGTITLQGEIDGVGNVAISDGKVNFLATAGVTYDPTVTIAGGEFAVSSTTVGNIVLNGGTLKGSSLLLGSLTMSDGTLAPGNSPGCMSFTGLTLTGGTYQVEIEGKDTICTQYDSVTVAGAVNLGTATTLSVPSFPATYTPAIGDDFGIILNDLADPITGTFQGLAEGGTLTVDGYTLAVSYVGGDGNDVVLTVTGVPAAAATPTTPATGIGSLITNPLLTMTAAFAVLGSVGALRYAEAKKSRK